MERNVAFIGFGEAAQAFAGGVATRAYDVKTNGRSTRDATRAEYRRAGVDGKDTAAEALIDADVVLSLVTADQALPAARAYAGLLAPQALWFDMNSVAPDTKRAAAVEIHAAGARYIDVAVLAPVHPQRRDVPLVVSGPHAEAGAAALADIGFSSVRIAPGGIGAASSIKMIRSMMVKGMEALTAEWILAAEAAGIREEAVAALNASWPGVDWAEQADYNLDRMMLHGVRRAIELEEVVKTLDALGAGSEMTRSSVERHLSIGELGLTPPSGLSAKLDTLLKRSKDRAA
jgi:3-hydroxyisobutyrate dehydrogenase-like beta-hydroxyacid dehydrogenase